MLLTASAFYFTYTIYISSVVYGLRNQNELKHGQAQLPSFFEGAREPIGDKIDDGNFEDIFGPHRSQIPTPFGFSPLGDFLSDLSSPFPSHDIFGSDNMLRPAIPRGRVSFTVIVRKPKFHDVGQLTDKSKNLVDGDEKILLDEVKRIEDSFLRDNDISIGDEMENGKDGVEKDRSVVEENKVKLGKDKPQTGKDKSQVGKDKPQTGKDESQVGKDKSQTRKDESQVGKDKHQTGKDKSQLGKDNSQVGKDKPQIRGYRYGSEKGRDGTIAKEVTFEVQNIGRIEDANNYGPVDKLAEEKSTASDDIPYNYDQVITILKIVLLSVLILFLLTIIVVYILCKRRTYLSIPIGKKVCKCHESSSLSSVCVKT